MSPGPGSCAMMGTANTMSIAAEALGLTMPDCACAHAVMGSKNRNAKTSGLRIVELVEKNICPRGYCHAEHAGVGGSMHAQRRRIGPT